jgi:hypothetical protein
MTEPREVEAEEGMTPMPKLEADEGLLDEPADPDDDYQDVPADDDED